MTSILGRTGLEKHFKFEPGSRTGIAIHNIDIPTYKEGIFRIRFLKGDVCEITDSGIVNLSNVSSARTDTWNKLVHQARDRVLGTEPISRSTGRAGLWAGPGYPGFIKSLRPAAEWPFPVEPKPQTWPIEYKRVREPVPTQAVLMDELAKEAQDDARYNAVSSYPLRSEVDRV